MKKVLFVILAIAFCTTPVFAADDSFSNSLPIEYAQVEYLETTGTQYIKTGVNVTGNTRVVAKMMCLQKNDLGSYAYLFASKTPLFSCRLHWNNGKPYNTYGSTTSIIFQNAFVGDLLNIDYGTGEATINTYSKNLDYVEFSDGELQIFALNGGKKSKGRVYQFKVYDGPILIRDFIPCYRKSDNAVGLFDVVNLDFYTNAGTGVFSVPVDLPDIPVIPDVPDIPSDSMNSMDAFFAMMSGIVSCMQIPMNIWGFAFSLWDVFMFSMVSAVIFGFIGKLFNM